MSYESRLSPYRKIGSRLGSIGQYFLGMAGNAQEDKLLGKRQAGDMALLKEKQAGDAVAEALKQKQIQDAFARENQTAVLSDEAGTQYTQYVKDDGNNPFNSSIPRSMGSFIPSPVNDDYRGQAILNMLGRNSLNTGMTGGQLDLNNRIISSMPQQRAARQLDAELAQNAPAFMETSRLGADTARLNSQLANQLASSTLPDTLASGQAKARGSRSATEFDASQAANPDLQRAMALSKLFAAQNANTLNVPSGQTVITARGIHSGTTPNETYIPKMVDTGGGKMVDYGGTTIRGVSPYAYKDTPQITEADVSDVRNPAAPTGTSAGYDTEDNTQPKPARQGIESSIPQVQVPTRMFTDSFFDLLENSTIFQNAPAELKVEAIKMFKQGKTTQEINAFIQRTLSSRRSRAEAMSQGRGQR